MTDDLAPRFGDLGEARPLPADFRERLERVLVAEAEVGAGALASVDAPRPLPRLAVDRIETAMLVAADVGPMPDGLRRRLERSLVPRRRRLAPALSAAAVVFALVASASMLSGPTTPTAPPDVSALRGESSGEPMVVGDGSVAETPQFLTSDPVAAGRSAGGDSAGPPVGGTAGRTAPDYLPYEPPPFYRSSVFGEAMRPPPGEPSTRVPPPAREPLRVGVIGGDPVQEKGFRAYIDLVNAHGGAGGRRLDVVPHDAGATVATVNLSSGAVADAVGPPPGVPAPLLESLDVPEPALHRDVFSLTGVAERQAHLAVDAAGMTADETAAIYVARAGTFAGRVPDAFERALAARGTHVVRVQWDPAGPPPLVPADGAFVSLPTEEARSWLDAAKAAGYDPRRGMWGIWSLADESLVEAMPAELQLLAPYTFTRGEELATMMRATFELPSARLVHGWVTAKWLAVAVWRAGDNPARLSTYLRHSDFESGFAPTHQTRGQTNSRTPEAVILVPEQGRLEPRGTFRRDNAF